MPFIDPNTVLNPTAGGIGTAAWGDALRDAIVYLADPPHCRVYNSANISIPNNTLTALTFDSERVDTDTMHSTVTNTGRITMTTAGWYDVGASIQWPAAAAGARAVYLRVNGTNYIAATRLDNAAQVDMEVSTSWQFAAGDYIEVIVFQVSGGALNVIAAASSSPEAWATWRAR